MTTIETSVAETSEMPEWAEACKAQVPPLMRQIAQAVLANQWPIYLVAPVPLAMHVAARTVASWRHGADVFDVPSKISNLYHPEVLIGVASSPFVAVTRIDDVLPDDAANELRAQLIQARQFRPTLYTGSTLPADLASVIGHEAAETILAGRVICFSDGTEDTAAKEQQ